jgi:hypothetical protein
MAVILTPVEAKTRRITVKGQPRPISSINRAKWTGEVA